MCGNIFEAHMNWSVICSLKVENSKNYADYVYKHNIKSQAKLQVLLYLYTDGLKSL